MSYLLVSVPLGPHGSLARPGEQVEGQPQDVSEAVQLTLTHVEAVQRLVSLEELDKLGGTWNAARTGLIAD